MVGHRSLKMARHGSLKPQCKERYILGDREGVMGRGSWGGGDGGNGEKVMGKGSCGGVMGRW